MNYEINLLWSWLNVLTKKRFDDLLKNYGSLENALPHLNEEILQQLGCREETVFKVLNRLEEFNSQAYQKELRKRDLNLISVEDEQYPSILKEIPDPPVFLYYQGDLSILSKPCVGLVGTREITSYGRRAVEEFIPPLVSAQVTTISGLALGIDAAVAQETIRHNGKTAAVLGHGLGSIYPNSNRKLAEEIINKGGLLLSEYPLDIAPDKYTFPARNRIIAGLSLATVVLEAGEDSGALITARLANDYNRDVFAVPGQIFDKNYAGCNQLINRGEARLVNSASQILNDIGIITFGESNQNKSTYVAQDETEAKLLEVLTTMPQSATDISQKSNLDTATINAALTMMELGGGVKNVGGGMWVKI